MEEGTLRTETALDSRPTEAPGALTSPGSQGRSPLRVGPAGPLLWVAFGTLVVCRGSRAGLGVCRPAGPMSASNLLSDGGQAPAPGWASISPSAEWRRLGTGVGEGAFTGCQERPRSAGPGLQLCGGSLSLGLASNFRIGRDPGTTEPHRVHRGGPGRPEWCGN